MRGSIQKINRPGGNAYLAKYEIAPDPETGKRRQKSKTFRTKKEAGEWLSERLAEQAQGTAVNPNSVTVAEYMRHWLDTSAKHRVRATTFESYKRLVDTHITPGLGKRKLQEVRPLDIQRFLADLLEGGRKDGQGGGLSSRTVRYVAALMHAAFGQAVKWQLLARNPMDAVDLPTLRTRRHEVWTDEQIKAFFRVASRDHYWPYWLVVATTGLRRGEALGLRWQDLDLERGVAHIRQSVVASDGGVSIHEPKTERGRRALPLPPSTVDALKAYRPRWESRRVLSRREGIWQETDLVFCTATGQPVNPRNILRKFKVLIDKAELPEIPLHGLRHSHATMLLESGISPKVISERLGHANIGITLDVYSHVLPHMQQEASDIVQERLFGERATEAQQEADDD